MELPSARGRRARHAGTVRHRIGRSALEHHRPRGGIRAVAIAPPFAIVLLNTVPHLFTRGIMRRVSVAVLVLALPSAAAGQAGAPRQAGAQQSDQVAERRVDSLLKQMTLDEKVRLIAGTNGFDIHGVARLGIPQLSAGDSPFGIRASGPATLYAGGISLAATWNTELATRVGAEI